MSVSVIKKELKKGIHLQLSDVWLAVSGLIGGLQSANELSGLLMFCIMGYYYQKSFQELFELVLFFLVGSFLQGSLTLYQNGLILLFFGLLILFVKVIHCSMFHAMPWIVSAVGFLMVLVHRSSMIVSAQSAIFVFVLMKCCSSEKILIQRQFKISEMIFSCMISILLIQFKSILSFQQFLLVLGCWMVLSSLWFESSSVLATFGLLILMIYPDVHAFVWLVSALSVHYLKSMKLGLLVIYPVICAILNQSFLMGAEGLLLISLAFCLPERTSLQFLEQDHEEHLLKLRLRNKEQLLQHQLNQFSHIFDTIADYYETHPETSFLKGMSESMSLLAMQMKQSALSQEDEAYKILELLKGYHYDVQKVYVTQSDLGIRRITILMSECVRKDIDDVILPLLRMSVDQNLKLISCQKAHKFSQNLKLEFSGDKPLGLKAKAYQRLDKNHVSGDTCSIFTSGQTTICTISDGMGMGEHAQKTSEFVTYLTQRLLSCKIPIEMIVKSINSLCTLQHAENFATLDFMCFDALNHRVVFAKNGAAPSYLIRGKEIMKIEGHALPLGIISQISADCFMMDVKEKDILLMCSDGVDEAMLNQWLRQNNIEEMKKQIKTLIQNGEKRDDISVIVAEVL